MVPGQGPGHGRPANRQSRLAATSGSMPQDYQQRSLKQGASSSSQFTDFAIAVPQPETYDSRLRHKQQKSVQVVAGWLTQQVQEDGSPMAPSPILSTTFSTLNVMTGADDYYGEQEEGQQLQQQPHEQQQMYMTGGTSNSRVGWSPYSTLPYSTGGGRQLSAIPAYVAEEEPMQQGPLQIARTASGDPLLLAGQQLSVARATTPHLYNNNTGGPVLAADGSVLQLAPQEPVLPPLARPLPPTVPYLVNSHGAPYGICVGDGQIYPLVLTAAGEVWWGPDGLPLMCCPRDDPTAAPGADGCDSSPIRALITASGDGLQGPGGVPVGVQLQWDSGNIGSTEPATVAAAIDLATGLVLSDGEGYRLRVDAATLELVNAKGNQRFDRQGNPLRLQAAAGSWVGPTPVLRLPGLQDMSALAAAAAQPSWVLLGTGAALAVQVVLRLVLGFSAVTSVFVLALLLLVAAAAAGAAALVARRPLPVPLPAPALLDMHGRPLRDARGQRLCLVTGAGHPQVITDTGDPVCLTVEGPSGESILVPSLPLRRGGARQDLVVDGAGRALAGYQGARLKLLLDAQRTPLLSPLGFPMALALTGAPYTGPSGDPLFTTPDGKVLLGAAGQPLLAPGGQMLGLGPHGNLLQADGNPLLGPGKQRMYLGPCGTATASPGGGNHHALARRLQGGAGTEEVPLPVLQLAPAPAVCSAVGAALSDALGRPLVVGPLGSLFSYHKTSSSWWWQTELWKTAAALAAAAAARRGEQPLGRAGSVAAGGWGTRHTQLLSQYGTAVEGEEGYDEGLPEGEEEEEEEPESPGAWPPAAVEYVPMNKAGLAVRSTKQPSGQWASSMPQQMESLGQQQQEEIQPDDAEAWDVVPMQPAAPQQSSMPARTSQHSSQQQGLASSAVNHMGLPASMTTTSGAGGAAPLVPASAGVNSMASSQQHPGTASVAGSLSAGPLLQQQQAGAVPAGSGKAQPGRDSSWPHWVEGVLLLVQLSLAQHAVLLPWAETYSGMLQLAQAPLTAGAAGVHEWLASSSSTITANLHHLAHHPVASQVVAALGSSIPVLLVLLALTCWLVVAYPHEQYLQEEIAAMDPRRQPTGAPGGPAGLSSRRVSSWWLEAVGAASGAAAAGPPQPGSRWPGAASVRGPVWGGYPTTATADIAKWLLAAWPIPHAAIAAGLLLTILLRRLLAALQLVPMPVSPSPDQRLTTGGGRHTTGGGRRSTTGWQLNTTQQLNATQQQQQQPRVVSRRPALLTITGAWLWATLALASVAVLLSVPWGLPEQQATLQQLPYLHQAAELAAMYDLHDPSATRSSSRPGALTPRHLKQAQPQPLQRPGSSQQRQQPRVPGPKVAEPAALTTHPADTVDSDNGGSASSRSVPGASKVTTPPASAADIPEYSPPTQVLPAGGAGYKASGATLPQQAKQPSGGLLWGALVLLGKLLALALLAGGGLVWWAQASQSPSDQGQGEQGGAGSSSPAPEGAGPSPPQQPSEHPRGIKEPRASGPGSQAAEVGSQDGSSAARTTKAGTQAPTALQQPLQVQVEELDASVPVAAASSCQSGGKVGGEGSVKAQGRNGSPAVSADNSVGSAGASMAGPTTPNVTTDRSAPAESSSTAVRGAAPNAASGVGGLRAQYGSSKTATSFSSVKVASHALAGPLAARSGLVPAGVGMAVQEEEVVEVVEEEEEEPVLAGRWRVVDGGLIWTQPSAEAAAAAAAAAREMPVRRVSASGMRSRQASSTGDGSRRQSLA